MPRLKQKKAGQSLIANGVLTASRLDSKKTELFVLISLGYSHSAGLLCGRTLKAQTGARSGASPVGEGEQRLAAWRISAGRSSISEMAWGPRSSRLMRKGLSEEVSSRSMIVWPTLIPIRN
jgi:hypothetical protein